MPPAFPWDQALERTQKARGMLLCSALRPQRCTSPEREPADHCKIKGRLFPRRKGRHFPQHALVPLKFSTKCIRKCWHVWALKWIRKPQEGQPLGSSQIEDIVLVGKVCEVTCPSRLGGSRTPWMWSPAYCEGLQAVGFSLKVTIRCLVLKYHLLGDSRLSFQKCLILNPTRSKDWQRGVSSRVSELITSVLDWDRDDAGCLGQRQPVGEMSTLWVHTDLLVVSLAAE